MLNRNLGVLTKAGAPTDGVNEVQTLTIDATGGTFTVTWNGQTAVTPLAHNPTAAQVLAVLESLSNLEVGDIAVSGNQGGPFSITFKGNQAGKDVAAISTTSSLTGGAGTATITTGTAGVRGDYRGCIFGQLLVDTTNRIIYENTSTERGRPVWTEIAVT